MSGRLWLKKDGGGGGDGGGDGWMIDNDYRSRRWIDVFYFIYFAKRSIVRFIPSSFAFSRFDRSSNSSFRFDFSLSIGEGEGGKDSSTRDLLIESIERSKYNGVRATNSRACVCTAAVWETKKVNGDGIKDEGTSETRR